MAGEGRELEQLAFVKVALQLGPGRVRDHRVRDQLLDGRDDRPILVAPAVGCGTRLDSRNVLTGQMHDLASDRDMLTPFERSLAQPADPQDDQLAMTRPKRTA